MTMAGIPGLHRLRGQGLLQRALRGSALTMIGFGGQQFIRLVSNLILTRLLFPEVFGLMALIMVIIQGLNNFSDMGITPAILQSRRGTDRDFLDTAFTMQAIRGVLLWLGCCVLAVPAARFYEAPELVWYLPLAGFTAVFGGVTTTKVESVNRELALGRLTLLELLASFLSMLITIALALAIGSALALVLGMVLGAVLRPVLAEWMLPGSRNRLRWDPTAVAELFRFGRWIFPSTIVGFAISQGDRAILGKYLNLEQLGIYNIAYFLASFPLLLASAVIWRIIIPVYRELPPDQSRANFLRLRKLRMALTGSFVGLIAVAAMFGPWLVGVLYDARYADAGRLVPMIALATLPQVVLLGYDQVALAAGNSRVFFLVTATRAVLFVALFWLGVHVAGIGGGLAGQATATLLAYPAIIAVARRFGAWDPLHDGIFAALGLGLAALAFLP